MLKSLVFIVFFSQRITHSVGAALCPNLKNCPILTMLSKNEMADIFGVDDPARVPRFEITLPIRRESRMIGDPFPPEMSYSIEAFNQPLTLALRQNNKLVSAGLIVTATYQDRHQIVSNSAPNCHYIGTVNGLADTNVAISNCDNDLKGSLLIDWMLLHLIPLPKRLRPLLMEAGQPVPHIIRMGKGIQGNNDITCTVPSNCPTCQKFLQNNFAQARQIPTLVTRSLKVSVFFDDEAVKRFQPLQMNDQQLRDFLLTFMNQVSMAYHHPTLGLAIDITVTHINIMHQRPSNFPTYNGDAKQLIDRFGDYQKESNPPGNLHWNHAVYLTGLDIFTEDNPGIRTQGVTGYGNMQYMCDDRRSVSMAEIGISDSTGSPETAAGFSSAYIIAHEMGHNLGMLHDGQGLNQCNNHTFIMSSSRSSEGQTSWSTCSQSELNAVLSEFGCLNGASSTPIVGLPDSTVTKQLPGQVYDADDQCKIFTKKANYKRANEWSKICQSLQCSIGSNFINLYSGPALEGTFCGEGKWCHNGNCESWGAAQVRIERNPNWSAFQNGNCQSGCIEKSKGGMKTTRLCNNPKPTNSEATCVGDEATYSWCDDTTICPSRIKANDYATKQCVQYLALGLKEFLADGQQLNHVPGQDAKACKIYCRAASGSGSINPETRGFGYLATFPDGTWCHNDGTKDYFCLNNMCKAG